MIDKDHLYSAKELGEIIYYMLIRLNEKSKTKENLGIYDLPFVKKHCLSRVRKLSKKKEVGKKEIIDMMNWLSFIWVKIDRAE